MNQASSLLPLARNYFLVMGFIMIAGGAIGFVKARSVASLIAGGVSGLLLILSACLFGTHVQAGLIIGLVVSLLLAGRFIPALLRGKLMPAGYVAPLAVIGSGLALWLLLRLPGVAAP